MDGRRHSVDIPISKKLVALRRVRSLRDPSTNSLTKFSALVDNVNWDTNSADGINLGFGNGNKDNVTSDNHVLGLKDLVSYVKGDQHSQSGLGLHGKQDQHHSSYKFDYGHRESTLMFGSQKTSGWVENTCYAPLRTVYIEGPNLCQSNQVVHGRMSLSERYCNDVRDKGVEWACVTSSSDSMEDVGSCNEPNERSGLVQQIDHCQSICKCRNRINTRSSRVMACDSLSRVGSPCHSIGEAPPLSSQTPTLNGNEEVNFVDSVIPRCGIRCCWSRTPIFRGSNLLHDIAEKSLRGKANEKFFPGQRRGWRDINSQVTPHVESPRSISQKFRPKSFSELIGQNVVTTSLSSVFLKENPSPFYLFYGPRGTGKSSAAKIFAAGLNCGSDELKRPCGLCPECVLLFSGRSRDIKELDSLRINRLERINILVKSAAIPPASCRFKIFIVDECHLVQGQTWATILNNLANFTQNTIFIMITPHLDQLPHSMVSKSQKYHFPKLKEDDIAGRLKSICMVEGIHFDQDAIDFVAMKSNGSLRDAEMMLEQLSLLGERITLSIVHSLTGVVSDEELLILLHLALSSDASNTVKRARELMRSSIDPMQLISQLANLIMDILSGKCEEGASEVKRKFCQLHTSETGKLQLSRALKILSETEKRLRFAKNQTTWLTVALLQLSSMGSSYEESDSRLCLTMINPEGGDAKLCSISSTGESLQHHLSCSCDEACKIDAQIGEETRESIWRRATASCESRSLKSFLWKQGKLSSISLNQGVAVVELEFHRPTYASKAEKSWKLIANSLQSVLDCNVEIRINVAHNTFSERHVKAKQRCLGLFSCCKGWQKRSHSAKCENSPSESSASRTMNMEVTDKFETHTSDSEILSKGICCHRSKGIKTIRSSDGNVLSIKMGTP